MTLGFARGPCTAAAPVRSVHPGVIGNDPAGGSDLVDDPAGVGDQHPGDGRRPPRRPVPMPAGRLASAAGCTASPCTSGGSEPLTDPDVASFSAPWASARLSRNEIGDRTAWAICLGRGQVGERAPHVGLEPLAEPPEITPQATDLPGHLGQLVRTEHDEGHHQDDQHLGRAEERHEPECTGASGGGCRAVRPPVPGPHQVPSEAGRVTGPGPAPGAPGPAPPAPPRPAPTGPQSRSRR